MKISLLEPLGVSAEYIQKFADACRAKGHTFTYYDNKTTDIEELKRRSEGQDIVMIANNPYPDEVVRSADSLKMIAVAFTGIDHVGLAACKEKGITVCNCAGYSNVSVAELSIGMTIGLLRKFHECDEAVRTQKTSAGLMGMEIAGKTVGIVGCGKIGLRAAKLYQAFGADVLAYARTPKAEWAEEGIKAVDLESLLKESDIVVIMLPLNDSTRGFLDKDKLALMKPSALLINCARGPIIDNAALADALNEERIAGAAIDVFDMEPPIPSDYCLQNAKNILLTPHIGFLTKEAMIRRADIEFDNVLSYTDGIVKNQCAV